MHLHLHQGVVGRLHALPRRWRWRRRSCAFSDVVLKTVQGVGRLLDHSSAERRTPNGVELFAYDDLIFGKIFAELRSLSADDRAQNP